MSEYLDHAGKDGATEQLQNLSEYFDHAQKDGAAEQIKCFCKV